nr:MAG TPA: hypothetical protein [Bacteriophage sp.]
MQNSFNILPRNIWILFTNLVIVILYSFLYHNN